jgi:serine/threonine protein kinase
MRRKKALDAGGQPSADAPSVNPTPRTPTATPIDPTGSTKFGQLRHVSPARGEHIVVKMNPDVSGVIAGGVGAPSPPSQGVIVESATTSRPVHPTPPPPGAVSAPPQTLPDNRVPPPLLDDPAARHAAEQVTSKVRFERARPVAPRRTAFELVKRLFPSGSTGPDGSDSSAASSADVGDIGAKRGRSEVSAAGRDAADSPERSIARSEHQGHDPHKLVSARGRVSFGPLPGQRRCRNAEDFQRGARISEGVYGVVYKGVDKKSGNMFALKWIKSKWFAESKVGFPDYLLREIDLLCRVSHPRVLNATCLATVALTPEEHTAAAEEAAKEAKDGTVTASKGSQSTKLFIVSEYGGFNLRSEIYRGEALSLSSVKHLLFQLLDGLAFLHSHNVAHRDLKPSNVLVDAKGDVQLCDMGLARFVRPREPNLTMAVVTLMYRGPEIHLGYREYDTSLDMWAVGCIAAELLIKQPLFPATEDPEHLQVVCEVMGAPTNDVLPNVLALRPAAEALSRVRVTADAANASACYSARFAPEFQPGPASGAFSCLRLRKRIQVARPDLFAESAPNRSDALALLDLVDRALQWNPAARISASEALSHSFFHSGVEVSTKHLLARRTAYEAERAQQRAAEHLARVVIKQGAAAVSLAAAHLQGRAVAKDLAANLTAGELEAIGRSVAQLVPDDTLVNQSQIIFLAREYIKSVSRVADSAALGGASAAEPLVADRVVPPAEDEDEDRLLEQVAPADGGVQHIVAHDDDD